jgi:hypothetical protein
MLAAARQEAWARDMRPAPRKSCSALPAQSTRPPCLASNHANAQFSVSTHVAAPGLPPKTKWPSKYVSCVSPARPAPSPPSSSCGSQRTSSCHIWSYGTCVEGFYLRPVRGIRRHVNMQGTQAMRTNGTLSYAYQPARPDGMSGPDKAEVDEREEEEEVSKTRTRIGGFCNGGSVMKVNSIKPASRVLDAACSSTRPRCARSARGQGARECRDVRGSRKEEGRTRHAVRSC